MPLHREVDENAAESADLDINPIYVREQGHQVPRYQMPRRGMLPDTALQVVRDELILDGNARLNLATFVTTWMEPQAQQLMAECFDKNMIDKDEYPQTAELERRCVNILAHLWHAPASGAWPPGDHRTGLLDHRIERGMHARRDGPAMALAGAQDRRQRRDLSAEPGHGRQRAGLLGEVLPVLAGGTEDGADGTWQAAPDRP